MQLSHMTWRQVETCLAKGAAVMVPVGSTEQHGPMGRIGTDTICAEAVALAAAEICGAIVAPSLAYTPAPFNTAFPGTVSMPEDLFQAHAAAVFRGLLVQGFRGIYVVNGHGANIRPLEHVARDLAPFPICLRSWWEPAEVNLMRKTLYGDWEGMHATPSEIAITEALLGALPEGDAVIPPKPLSADYIRAHSGDRHGPPDAHRAEFPDGRVGSHSALANPVDGARLLESAARGIAADFTEFLNKVR